MTTPVRALWACLLTLLLTMGVDTPTLAQARPQGQFKAVPPLQARVTDEVGMLTGDQRKKLESVLADYETQTGSQIAVLLVESTEPEAIEQYGIRVTDAWKLGRKGVDDGVLLLVARDNPKALRRLRIEAGRGVQGVLTDAQSKRILQDVIAPHFRQNDYYGGLVAGVGAIQTLLNQEKLPAPAPQAAPVSTHTHEDDGPNLIVTLFPIIVGLLILRSVFRSRGARLARPGIGGQFNNGWGSGMTGVVLGNILANAAHDNDHRWRNGGFSGSDGSPDIGGGGFSGGGGSFDGGGASGDW